MPVREPEGWLRFFTAPCFPSNPIAQSHPYINSRPSRVVSLHILPQFQEDCISRFWWNTLLSSLLSIPSDTLPIPIPKRQLSIPRNTFYLGSPVATSTKSTENFLAGNTQLIHSPKNQSENRNEGTKHQQNQISAPRNKNFLTPET